MKFTCSRDLLIDGLNIVMRAIPAKSNLSVLEGVLIEITEDLLLTGTDNDISITYQVGAIIEEIGSVVVDARTFSEIVKRMPDVYVTCETSENGAELIITSGSAQFKIPVMNAAQYPKVNFVSDNEECISLSKNNFKSLVKMTAFAASIDSPRAILRGVLIENKNNVLRFVAIDGFRLAMKTVESTFEKDFSIIVPAKTLTEISKIIEKSDENVNFTFNENQIVFSNSNFSFISSLFKGEFVDYAKMIPTDIETTMHISPSDLANSIDRVAVVINDDRKWPIILKTYPDELFISVAGENGSSHEVIPAEISGKDLEINFNKKNLVECIKNIDKEKISVKFTTAKGPCVISCDEDDSFLMLVMPVKPKAK